MLRFARSRVPLKLPLNCRLRKVNQSALRVADHLTKDFVAVGPIGRKHYAQTMVEI